SGCAQVPMNSGLWSATAPRDAAPPPRRTPSVEATQEVRMPSDRDSGAQSRSQRDERNERDEQEARLAALRDEVQNLEDEIVVLRRRLQDAPKRVRTLEERLLETKGQLAQAMSQNEKLSATLREAREHIAALREEVEKLTMPPNGYGTFLGANDD